MAELHEVLRGYPGELPTDGPLGDITRLVDLVDRQQLLTGTELSTLRAETETLRDALAVFPVQPLHGDAHQGNALATPNGVVWIDFEDTWRGPIAWDLASPPTRTARISRCRHCKRIPTAPATMNSQPAFIFGSCSACAGDC